jgi:hypothetical protein
MEGRKRQKGNQKPNNQNNKNKNKPFDFLEELHAPESINVGPAAAHRFEVSPNLPQYMKILVLTASSSSSIRSDWSKRKPPPRPLHCTTSTNKPSMGTNRGRIP